MRPSAWRLAEKEAAKAATKAKTDSAKVVAKLGSIVKMIGELKANEKVKKLPKVVKSIFVATPERVEAMLAEARPKLEEVAPRPLSFDLAEVRTGKNGGPGPGARGPGPSLPRGRLRRQGG